MTWRELIIRDPAICRGRPTIKGTRIMVSVVLDNLAAGRSPEEIATAYPPLTTEQVSACLSYAAWLAHEEVLPLPAAE